MVVAGLEAVDDPYTALRRLAVLGAMMVFLLLLSVLAAALLSRRFPSVPLDVGQRATWKAIEARLDADTAAAADAWTGAAPNLQQSVKAAEAAAQATERVGKAAQPVGAEAARAAPTEATRAQDAGQAAIDAAGQARALADEVAKDPPAAGQEAQRIDELKTRAQAAIKSAEAAADAAREAADACVLVGRSS